VDQKNEMNKQKEIFLNSEGDSWFERNHQAIQNREYTLDDPVISAISRCKQSEPWGERLLEVGCGEGKRLGWIQENLNIECFGIEPSAKAVSFAKLQNIEVRQGTADQLPYDDSFFEFVVFGFCLYLCDREDLFRIAHEVDRVLKPNSWLIIQDFFSTTPIKNRYHHRDGIYSFKMDYRRLFDWHPNYICLSHEILGHESIEFTDDPNEFVATSVLRKSSL
jgi:ubiquinone/menaquinone biosynthesis C-methylase UbiE